MKTIAIANQKGGTGKTTTAYNLGIALTQQGYSVLMVDFDPQGNLSCYCGIPPEQDLEQTITELLMKVAYEKPLSHRECVYQSKRTDDSAPQVDFIPSNLRLASFELAMGTMMCREVLLKTCLEQYSSQYDYCIIDCSPSVGLLLTNALSAANEVIIPMQAQPFSVVGMSQLTNSISSVQRKINPGLHIRGVLLTMTQHTKVSEHYAHDVRAKYGRTLRVFTTEIPYNVKVQESQAFAAPTILYEPKSSSARAYVDFTQEVLGHGREEQVYERDEDAQPSSLRGGPGNPSVGINLDCSSFVQYCYWAQNLPFSAGSTAAYRNAADLVSISPSEVQPGDLRVVYASGGEQGHVQMALGGGAWIECCYGYGVAVNMSNTWMESRPCYYFRYAGF